MKNIQAFCLAKNIEINEYPYEETFNNLIKFCNKINIAVVESEDNTEDIIKNLKDKYPIEYKVVRLDSKGNQFLRDGKDIARKMCSEGWIYLADLDEILLNPSIIISLNDSENFNYWFPFLNFCDKETIVDKVYMDVVPRLFYNTNDSKSGIWGDGFAGFNLDAYNKLMLNCPILHYGFSSENKWKQKHKYYEQEDIGIPQGIKVKYLKRNVKTPEDITINFKFETCNDIGNHPIFSSMTLLGRVASNAYKGCEVK